MPLLLAVLFLATATLYASVGFGGGSTYTAILAVTGADYLMIPVLSLSCNIAVVSGSCWRYGRAGLLSVRRLAPALVVSVPLAWLGGRVQLSEQVFLYVLAAALVISGLVLLVRPPRLDSVSTSGAASGSLYLAGGATGLLAGLVGIGGGIFLAPVLYMMRWGEEKQIAAASSLFILLNSIAGLAGQFSKPGLELEPVVQHLVWLVPAVVLGGWIGNRLGILVLPAKRVRQATGLLILIVAVRLLFRATG